MLGKGLDIQQAGLQLGADAVGFVVLIDVDRTVGLISFVKNIGGSLP